MNCLHARGRLSSAAGSTGALVFVVCLALGAAGPAGADEHLELTLAQAIELALERSDALAVSRSWLRTRSPRIFSTSSFSNS